MPWPPVPEKRASNFISLRLLRAGQQARHFLAIFHGFRLIVLADDDVIDIEIGEYKAGERQEVEASFDGRDPVSLNEGDKIRIIRSDKVAKIIKLGRGSFLDTLQKKMSVFKG